MLINRFQRLTDSPESKSSAKWKKELRDKEEKGLISLIGLVKESCKIAKELVFRTEKESEEACWTKQQSGVVLSCSSTKQPRTLEWWNSLLPI